MADSLMTTGSMALQCPLCEGVVEVEAPAVGAQVECPDCGELFLLAALDPPELVYALEMEAEAEFPDEERQAGKEV